VGGLLDSSAYAFTPLCLPYAIVALGVVGALAYFAFVRGHPLIRTSLLGLFSVGLWYTGAHTLGIIAADPAVALVW